LTAISLEEILNSFLFSLLPISSYLSYFSMFFSAVGHEGTRGMVALFYGPASACFQIGTGLVSGAKRFHTHYDTIAVIHRRYNPRDFSVQSSLEIQLQLMLE
jgi:hypothetical protein